MVQTRVNVRRAASYASVWLFVSRLNARWGINFSISLSSPLPLEW